VSPNLIGGADTNAVIAGVYGATIGGGGTFGFSNLATDHYGTIGGGFSNQAGDYLGTLDDSVGATVGGGYYNTASDIQATVGGGYYNTASGIQATVGGGRNSKASGYQAIVAGGSTNEASASLSNVGGGLGNHASGGYATVSGGNGNEASGNSSAVPGGTRNVALGDYSFAVGRRAKANHTGAFVWGDDQNEDITSTRDHEVTFRCLGGVRFTSGSGAANQTIAWAPGSSSWTPSSDRNLKENFVEIDPKEVLEKVNSLPVTEWNFKGYSQRHLGPVAQDFHALFPLGGSETMMDTGDLQGVSLAAIQGLHRLVQEKEGRIKTLEEQNHKLEARLATLEALVQTLAEEKKRGEE
jgi:hypothetical protein